MKKSTGLFFLGFIVSIIFITLSALAGEIFLVWVGLGLLSVFYVVLMISWALASDAQGPYSNEGVKGGGRRVRKKRIRPIVVIAIIVIVVAVATICGYLLMKTKGEEVEIIIYLAITMVCGMITAYLLMKNEKLEQMYYYVIGQP